MHKGTHLFLDLVPEFEFLWLARVKPKSYCSWDQNPLLFKSFSRLHGEDSFSLLRSLRLSLKSKRPSYKHLTLGTKASPVGERDGHRGSSLLQTQWGTASSMEAHQIPLGLGQESPTLVPLVPGLGLGFYCSYCSICLSIQGVILDEVSLWGLLTNQGTKELKEFIPDFLSWLSG